MAKNIYSYSFQQKELLKKQENELLDKLPMFCAEYIHKKNSNSQFQPRTRLAYLQEIYLFFEYLCSSHEDFMELTPDKITTQMMASLAPGDIDDYLSYVESYENKNGYRQNEAPGKARKLAAIRSLYKYLVSAGRVPYNIAASVDTPKIKRKDIVYMSTEQQEALLDSVYNGYHLNKHHERTAYKPDNAIHIRDVAIISLFLGTGIRISELVGLDINDVDFRDCSIYVQRKGGGDQKVYFADDVEDALLSYLDYSRSVLLEEDADEQALFISQRRKRISVRTVQVLLEKYTDYTFGKDEKKKISPHKLRSTYATNLLEETDDIYLVANVIGHSDLSTVARYSKFQKAQKGAINLRKKSDDREGNENNSEQR